jgi:MFS family permease
LEEGRRRTEAASSSTARDRSVRPAGPSSPRRPDPLEPDLIDAIGAGLLGRYYGVAYDPAGVAGSTTAADAAGPVETEVIDLRTPRPRRSREVRARWHAFRAYWNGHALSMVGDHLTLVALPIAADRLTHSALWVGLVVFAETLATVLFGVVAGTFTDRRTSRPLMIAADLGRALVLAGVVVLVQVGHYPVLLLVVASFLLGVMRLLFDGAHSAFVARLVPDELDVRSNNRLVLAENLGSTIGPLLAGAIIHFRLGLAFAVDGLTFVLSAVAIGHVGRILRTRRITLADGPRHDGTSTGTGRRAFRRDASMTLRLIRSRPVFVRALVMAAAFNLCALPVGQQFVTLARESLHLSAFGIGAMFALCGVAGIATAPFVERDPRIRPGLLPAATGAIGAVVFAVGVAPSRWTVGLAFVVGGVTFTFFMTHWAALRQRIFPPHQQGRVALAARAVMWSTVLVGSVLTGWLSDAVNPEAMWLGCGAAGLAAAAWGIAAGLPRDTVD